MEIKKPTRKLSRSAENIPALRKSQPSYYEKFLKGVVNIPIPLFTKPYRIVFKQIFFIIGHFFYCFLFEFEVFVLVKYLLLFGFRFYLENKLLQVERDEGRGEKKLEMIRKCKETIQDHENTVNLSLILEAGIESGFQFFLQSLVWMPSTVSQSGSWTDMINWTNVSIGLSFVSYAYTCVTIRLDYKSTLLLPVSYTHLTLPTTPYV